jgi:hypothetical protein
LVPDGAGRHDNKSRTEHHSALRRGASPASTSLQSSVGASDDADAAPRAVELSQDRAPSAFPRFHMHFTPTFSSCMNLAERFFGDLTTLITEKSFASTRELADAIITFLAAGNENPQRD